MGRGNVGEDLVGDVAALVAQLRDREGVTLCGPQWIVYGYAVSDTKWGHWFQRAVRLPTRRLSVDLVFPTSLEPLVWGMETSMSAEARAFRTAISTAERGNQRVFSWATEDPPLHARDRLEWSFRNTADEGYRALTAARRLACSRGRSQLWSHS